MTNTPSWWHDADQLYTVLTDLLRHLRRRASTFDERTEACLYLSGLHLDHGPWRYVQEVDAVGEIGFETGLVLVNELLARLQGLLLGSRTQGALSAMRTTGSTASSIRPSSPGSDRQTAHSMTTSDGP